MKISDVEKCSRVPAKTIRYYEELGLVRPDRLSNRYRDFSEWDVHRLGFLHRARHAGFSLRECRHLLALYEDGSHMPADVRAIAGKQMNRIERREPRRSAEAPGSPATRSAGGKAIGPVSMGWAARYAFLRA